MASPATNLASPDSSERLEPRRVKKPTGEQLAKKRAADREAQRSSRVKTKNYIFHLESRIEDLTKAKGTGDLKGLLNKIESQRKENEALRSTLKAIGKLVNPIASIANPNNPQKASAAADHHDDGTTAQGISHLPTVSNTDFGGNDEETSKFVNSTNDLDLSLVGGTAPSRNAVEWQSPLDPDTSQFGTLNSVETVYHDSPRTRSYASSIRVSPWDQLGWTALDPQSACQCSKSVRFSNEIFSKFSRMQLHNTANQTLRDADIPIRVVIHGWGAVTKKYSLDPMWATLRHIDEAIFSNCAPTERLVVLRLISLMLRDRLNSIPETLSALPSYLHERPSQHFIPHSPMIDYVVWPGLRERFVYAPHRYCSERYWFLFWSCFRFTWAFSFRDSYTRNLQTGLYQFSKTFEEDLRDLRNFCMLPEFLDEFPELKADIDSTKDRPEYIGYKEQLCEFVNFGEGFGVGSLEELDLLQAGFMNDESPFPSMDWAAVNQNTAIACEMDL